MLEENNSLQLKLHSQEEDFNLQNRTLMEELNRVGLYSILLTTIVIESQMYMYT